ncbi:1600_t:CDS:10 [Paraglomus brasilianum]|uniref:ubiquitinyl hydrolase 1 n=1 Tax=Paraglomus brasilianum TaxID=144538 RepID=A0A9N9D3A5_9GLOM|nr:1600_t:CDS:10 [Paraglomus brasilianum]
MEEIETHVDQDRQMSDVEEISPNVTDFEAFANKIMPNLGYDVEDFKWHTWHVTGWKSLDKRITGPEFEAGGWKWRILLFPFGNNNTETVSIYLDFADPKDAQPGWHACVQFALVLWNPEDPTHQIHHNAQHRFTTEESDWGFTRFYELRKLFAPCDRRTRPLIEGEAANITAFVRVLKDPTGVLWHNFINYDSKKETGYVGLKNQGATCYMNSLLQSLYCTNYFRKAVYQIPTETDEPTKSVALALQRVFYQLQTSDTPIGTTELTKSFGWDSYESFMQHDVQEFNRVLQDNLEGKMKNTKADGAISKLFLGRMRSYVKCVHVPYQSSRVEDYCDIQLNVKGCKTLRDSFKDYVQEETLDGENKYKAEGYDELQEAKKGVIFDEFPPVLHLQLKRFEYDIQKDAMIKINDRHEFPMEIDLEEFLSPEADRSQPHKYLLHGVLVHSGDLHGGHYFALLKPEKDGRWLKFDDDRVTPVTEKEVLEDNYGGEHSAISPPANIRPTGKIGKRFTNAYMLVYIRASAVDEILAPVLESDIPEHLRKRKRFIHCVISDESFKNHQGFDLANFDERHPSTEVTHLKVLKTEPYQAFKQKLAEQRDIPPERMRLWVLVNRQNKTVRPDTPVPETYNNLPMGDVHTKMASRSNELKLYMEIADKPAIDGRSWFPPTEGNALMMVFLKYFDPDSQSLVGLGHHYIQKFGKVGEISAVLCEKANLPPNAQLKIYEEIKPNMIEEMKPRATFQQSEIQDGDIIVFQKVLTEKDIQDHVMSSRLPDIPRFYEYLASRVVVMFKPRFPDRDSKPQFELVLNKKMAYDTVAANVAKKLNTDPLMLRFTTTAYAGNTPKNIIRRSTTQSLQDMLQPGGYLNPPSNTLYYEMLDVSIIELETKRFLKVIWLGTSAKEESTIDVRLPKTAHVSDILDYILDKVKLSAEDKKIRLLEVMSYKIQKEYNGTESISAIQDIITLYAEEIPDEELNTGPEDKVVHAYHFTKEPLRPHGIPFKFVIKSGEVFSETKKRLQARMGMNERDFAKVKVAIVQPIYLNKPHYVESDDQILSDMKWGPEDLLGLDHIDKTGRAGRTGAPEKAIYIRG